MPGAEVHAAYSACGGWGCLRGRVCLRAAPSFRVRVCLRGMGLSPGMSHADALIRKSGLEIGNRCTDCPCFDLLATSIRKSRLEIENRCTEVPGMMFAVAAIAKSGPEIRNRCTEVPGMNPIVAAIVKLTPSNQESLHGSPRNDPRSCSDCQIDPLKSRIAVRKSPK